MIPRYETPRHPHRRVARGIYIESVTIQCHSRVKARPIRRKRMVFGLQGTAY